MYGHTGDFATGIQAWDNLVVALGIHRNGLTVNIRGDTPHHVVAGRHYRYRLFDRIHMGEGPAQLADARQPRLQHLLTQVIELQFDVVAIFAAAPALQNLQHHGSSDNIPARQVLGVGCITLHKALTILVDQVAALTPTALGDQGTGAVNARGMELPHLHILHRHTGAQSHTNAVTGIDMGVGCRSIDAARAAGCKHRRLGFNKNRLSGLYANRDNPSDRPVLIFDQVDCKPLIKKHRLILDVILVKRVQQCVTGAVRRSTGASCLPTFPVVL